MEVVFQEENIMSTQKDFYLFQEVVTAADVKPYVLRFWETEFEDIKPNTLEDGKKSYSQKDIKIIHLIKKLLFDEKMSIPEAKVAIKQRLSEIDNISIDEITEASFTGLSDSIEEVNEASNEKPSEQLIEESISPETTDDPLAVELNSEKIKSEEVSTLDNTESETQECATEKVKETISHQANSESFLEIQPVDILKGSIHKAHAQLELIVSKIDKKLESLK
ncbi:MerR family transcriptional regulator [Bacteriovoracaceae bacterium]|nr:MerR family transcriptional regulator [Bacteriovoracaceae bacterium]